MSKIYHLYVIENKINKKKYVGITGMAPEKRYYFHKKANTPVSQAIQKYGDENFSFTPILCSKCLTDILFYEIEFIKELNTYMYESTGHGYNRTKGGENISPKAGRPVGTPMSEEEKEKRRKIKRSPFSEETKNKIRLSKLGKPCPFNEGENNPAKNPEVRAKIADKVSKREWEFISPTGEHIKIRNLKKYCEDRGLWMRYMSDMIKGKIPQYKGYTKVPNLSLENF